MNITEIIQSGIAKAVKELYQHEITPESVTLSPTRREFTGDYTVVVFPFTRAARKKPEQIGEELGNFIVEQLEEIESFNVIKGFLNLVVKDTYWLKFTEETFQQKDYGRLRAKGEKVMVEFASPNTNKPLHLGHIRNILLGWSCAQILDAAGYEVVKVQIVNDRGIAICKSMLAWQLFGNGETPESSGTKGDHLVGKYYVIFEQKFQEEYRAWQTSAEGTAVFKAKAKEDQNEAAFFKAFKNTYFNEYSGLGNQAKDMLLLWESNDPKTRQLWMMMNAWVYDGFEETYKNIGVNFDKLYFESDTYLLGKETVENGLKDQVFYQKEDQSVWIDLESAKLDHKIVLRSDGTSVYMTQDLGTAQLRYEDFGVNKMVYVVADEQDYHFKVLFEIMKRLKAPYAEGMHHLSYGMIDLTTGKMKSREGTVVDADDLMNEMIEAARLSSLERGELDGLDQAAQAAILRKVGMAALKYFILRVNPKKRMVFNPQESIELQGDTGPYIQYAFVRINGVFLRGQKEGISLEKSLEYQSLEPIEKELVLQVHAYRETLQAAAENFDPSLIASYSYQLAKTFNRFWHDLTIFGADDEKTKAYRLKLCKTVGNVLADAMGLLGIGMPERM